jgi:hypothetical protein
MGKWAYRGLARQGGSIVVFGRGGSREPEPGTGARDELIDSLLNADELERRLLLLEALQSGLLKKSQAADLIRFVERLEHVSRRAG